MTAIEFVRTPDERFANLPNFDFAPNYLEGLSGFDGLRMHYLDEGPKDAERVFLCLHGEPSWSFLYRKMIPIFAAEGRVVAPDFFGFGRSDKPVDDEVYTFDFHRESIIQLIERLNLGNITLVCQDWGGLIGLTLPMDFKERFTRLIVMNTALATGDREPSPGFLAWKEFMRSQPDLKVGKLMKRSTPSLTDEEAAAYDAPFEDVRSKAGVRRFPELVPISKEMDGAETSSRALQWWKTQWSGPAFMAVGMKDPVLGPSVMAALREVIPGCREPLEIEDAGHFVQESGDIVAKEALSYFASL